MSGGQGQGGGYGQPQGYGQQSFRQQDWRANQQQRPSWPGAYGQQQMWQGQQPQGQPGMMQGPWSGLAKDTDAPGKTEAPVPGVPVAPGTPTDEDKTAYQPVQREPAYTPPTPYSVMGNGGPGLTGGPPGQMYTGGTPGFYGNPTLPSQGYVTQPPAFQHPGWAMQGPWDGLRGYPQELPPRRPGGLLVDPLEATPPPGTYYGRKYP